MLKWPKACTSTAGGYQNREGSFERRAETSVECGGMPVKGWFGDFTSDHPRALDTCKRGNEAGSPPKALPY